MPKFTVLCRVDAYADYTAEVEADDAEEAAWIAHQSPSDFTWAPQGTCEFDASLYVALDAEGGEIEGTQCGKLG